MTANGPPDLLQRFSAVATARRAVLLRIARRVVGQDDAEDVVQNALMHTFVALDRFQGDDDGMAAWLQRSTHNTALDLLRHRAVLARFHASEREAAVSVLQGTGGASHPREWFDVLADPDPQPQEVAIRREEMAEAQTKAASLLSRLSGRAQRALWITAALGMTSREAGERWGVSLDTVKQIRDRAQRRLRAIAA